MRLNKFRIRNYKSILDSGDCYPTEEVTILAGKNEAGKSSLLEALEDFNIGTKIRSKAIPINIENAKPSIEIVFSVTKQELIPLLNSLGLGKENQDSFVAKLQDIELIAVTKTYPQDYEISAAFLSRIPYQKPPEWTVLLSTLAKTISSIKALETIRQHQLPSLEIERLDSEQATKTIDDYRIAVLPVLNELPESDRTQFLAQLNSLKQTVMMHAETVTTSGEKFQSVLLNQIPNFILFSAFDDVFPSEIPLGELESNKWITDLAAMSDINVATIIGENRNAKKQHKHKLNVQINEDFKQFWTQDLSSLSIDWDSEHLEFWIEEQGHFYPPELRSQGRRWHLAFYIRVSARSQGKVQNIILIDEPGLYLHATAQRDILKHLQKSSKSCQILISTHSPYLIEAEKLERVRLVQKNEERGTYVENKLHAVSDKETLTPILTAIGLELNQGIVGANQVDNVIVEGPSDYFYLTAFREIIGGLQANFISGGSSGNMPKIGTILQGWGCRVIYLYDNDQAFKDAQRSIKKDWLTISKEWLLGLNVDGSIEDVFSKEEFASIIGVSAEIITEKNSAFMKTNKRDKVLPARMFLQKVRVGEIPQFSEKTVITVKALLADLTSKLENYVA